MCIRDRLDNLQTKEALSLKSRFWPRVPRHLSANESSENSNDKRSDVPNYTRYTARINSDHVLLKGSDRDIIKIGEIYCSTTQTRAR